MHEFILFDDLLTFCLDVKPRKVATFKSCFALMIYVKKVLSRFKPFPTYNKFSTDDFKGEIAQYEYFLLLPETAAEASKCIFMWERVKSSLFYYNTIRMNNT